MPENVLTIWPHPFLSSPLCCSPLQGLPSLETAYVLESKGTLAPIGKRGHRDEEVKLKRCQCLYTEEAGILPGMPGKAEERGGFSAE